MSPPERKRIRGNYGCLDDYSTLKDLAAFVTAALQAESAGEWVNLEVEQVYDPYDPYGGDRDCNCGRLGIVGDRWETDKEMNARLKRQERERAAAAKLREKKAAAKAQKSADELKLYEQLKAKYGTKQAAEAVVSDKTELPSCPRCGRVMVVGRCCKPAAKKRKGK